MICHWNCAIAARTLTINAPVSSRGSVPAEVADPKVSALDVHPLDDLDQIGNRVREPVESGHNQFVAVTDEVDRRGELRPRGDAADLLFDVPLAALGFEIADLCLETGNLLDRRGPAVTHLHHLVACRTARP
jgi:hypothetical protein